MNKKILRLVYFMTVVVLLSFVLSVGAFCDDIYGRNVALITEKSGLLGELCEEYAALDKREDKLTAIKTSGVIIEYQNALNALRGDERIALEELSDEIGLLYEQGKVSGAVSWIYWCYADGLQDNGEVKGELEELLYEISELSDAEAVSEKSRELEGRMYISVFSRKLSLLYTAEDSHAVAGIAERALEDIKRIARGELTDLSYDEVYEKAAADITLQRQREAAEKIEDYYKEIVLGENYPDYSSEYKDLLIEKRDHYIQLIYDGGDIKSLLSLARLELKKCASCGEISILRGDDDSEAVREIIAEGIAALIAEKDIGALEGIVARTELRVACQRLYESAEREGNGYIDSFSTLKYISAERKEELISEIRRGLEVARGAILGSADIDAAGEEYSELLVALDGIWQRALLEERELAKSHYMSLAEKDLALCRGQMDTMIYLSEGRKTAYLYELEAELGELFEALETLSAVSELESRYHLYESRTQMICESAYAENLSGAAEHFIALSKALKEAKKSEISMLEFLSEVSEEEYFSELEAAFEECAEYILSAAGASEMSDVYEMLEERFDGIAIRAFEFNDAKRKYLEKLRARYGEYRAESYTESRYSQISEAYLTAVEEIKNADSAEPLDGIINVAFSKMSAVGSIFDDLKRELSESLSEEYKKFESLSENYGEKRGALFSIYSLAKSRIETAISAIGESGLREIYDSALKELRELPLSWVSSGSFGERSSAYSEYPAGYDTSLGLWGTVRGSAGIPYGVGCSMKSLPVSAELRSALRKGIKEGRLSYYGASAYSAEELKRLLGGLEARGVLDLKLTVESAIFNEFSGEYKVRVLLPEELRGVRGVWIAYISPTGEIEVLEAKREGSVLEFTTKHFSEFLVLGEKESEIISFIIIFSLLLLLLSAGVVVYFLRGRRRAVLAPVAIGELGGELSGVRELPALPAFLDCVSAEEASDLIGDSEAEQMVSRSEKKPNICRGCKKTFINVDTLSENYKAGEVVDLVSLKRKGLIPQSSCYLKVLARGRVDKPLEVRAQSFSRDAVKMITLTGGRAIIEGNE
ncbi:MAG: hypothetical protein E7641_08490 [Ruminococcaceae bacterium]|nr:hypothetical protein [Oscillospiraceae bacterium]